MDNRTILQPLNLNENSKSFSERTRSPSMRLDKKEDRMVNDISGVYDNENEENALTAMDTTQDSRYMTSTPVANKVFNKSINNQMMELVDNLKKLSLQTPSVRNIKQPREFNINMWTTPLKHNKSTSQDSYSIIFDKDTQLGLHNESSLLNSSVQGTDKKNWTRVMQNSISEHTAKGLQSLISDKRIGGNKFNSQKKYHTSKPTNDDRIKENLEDPPKEYYFITRKADTSEEPNDESRIDYNTLSLQSSSTVQSSSTEIVEDSDNVPFGSYTSIAIKTDSDLSQAVEQHIELDTVENHLRCDIEVSKKSVCDENWKEIETPVSFTSKSPVIAKCNSLNAVNNTISEYSNVTNVGENVHNYLSVAPHSTVENVSSADLSSTEHTSDEFCVILDMKNFKKIPRNRYNSDLSCSSPSNLDFFNNEKDKANIDTISCITTVQNDQSYPSFCETESSKMEYSTNYTNDSMDNLDDGDDGRDKNMHDEPYANILPIPQQHTSTDTDYSSPVGLYNTNRSSDGTNEFCIVLNMEDIRRNEVNSLLSEDEHLNESDVVARQSSDSDTTGQNCNTRDCNVDCNEHFNRFENVSNENSATGNVDVESKSIAKHDHVLQNTTKIDRVSISSNEHGAEESIESNFSVDKPDMVLESENILESKRVSNYEILDEANGKYEDYTSNKFDVTLHEVEYINESNESTISNVPNSDSCTNIILNQSDTEIVAYENSKIESKNEVDDGTTYNSQLQIEDCSEIFNNTEFEGFISPDAVNTGKLSYQQNSSLCDISCSLAVDIPDDVDELVTKYIRQDNSQLQIVGENIDSERRYSSFNCMNSLKKEITEVPIRNTSTDSLKRSCRFSESCNESGTTENEDYSVSLSDRIEKPITLNKSIGTEDEDNETVQKNEAYFLSTLCQGNTTENEISTIANLDIDTESENGDVSPAVEYLKRCDNGAKGTETIVKYSTDFSLTKIIVHFNEQVLEDRKIPSTVGNAIEEGKSDFFDIKMKKENSCGNDIGELSVDFEDKNGISTNSSTLSTNNSLLVTDRLEIQGSLQTNGSVQPVICVNSDFITEENPVLFNPHDNVNKTNNDDQLYNHFKEENNSDESVTTDNYLCVQVETLPVADASVALTNIQADVNVETNTTQIETYVSDALALIVSPKNSTLSENKQDIASDVKSELLEVVYSTDISFSPISDKGVPNEIEMTNAYITTDISLYEMKTDSTYAEETDQLLGVEYSKDGSMEGSDIVNPGEIITNHIDASVPLINSEDTAIITPSSSLGESVVNANSDMSSEIVGKLADEFSNSVTDISVNMMPVELTVNNFTYALPSLESFSVVDEHSDVDMSPHETLLSEIDVVPSNLERIIIDTVPLDTETENAVVDSFTESYTAPNGLNVTVNTNIPSDVSCELLNGKCSKDENRSVIYSAVPSEMTADSTSDDVVSLSVPLNTGSENIMTDMSKALFMSQFKFLRNSDDFSKKVKELSKEDRCEDKNMADISVNLISNELVSTQNRNSIKNTSFSVTNTSLYEVNTDVSFQTTSELPNVEYCDEYMPCVPPVASSEIIVINTSVSLCTGVDNEVMDTSTKGSMPQGGVMITEDSDDVSFSVAHELSKGEYFKDKSKTDISVNNIASGVTISEKTASVHLHENTVLDICTTMNMSPDVEKVSANATMFVELPNELSKCGPCEDNNLTDISQNTIDSSITSAIDTESNDVDASTVIASPPHKITENADVYFEDVDELASKECPKEEVSAEISFSVLSSNITTNKSVTSDQLNSKSGADAMMEMCITQDAPLHQMKVTERVNNVSSEVTTECRFEDQNALLTISRDTAPYLISPNQPVTSGLRLSEGDTTGDKLKDDTSFSDSLPRLNLSKRRSLLHNDLILCLSPLGDLPPCDGVRNSHTTENEPVNLLDLSISQLDNVDVLYNRENNGGLAEEVIDDTNSTKSILDQTPPFCPEQPMNVQQFLMSNNYYKISGMNLSVIDEESDDNIPSSSNSDDLVSDTVNTHLADHDKQGINDSPSTSKNKGRTKEKINITSSCDYSDGSQIKEIIGINDSNNQVRNYSPHKYANEDATKNSDCKEIGEPVKCECLCKSPNDGSVEENDSNNNADATDVFSDDSYLSLNDTVIETSNGKDETELKDAPLPANTDTKRLQDVTESTATKSDSDNLEKLSAKFENQLSLKDEKIHHLERHIEILTQQKEQHKQACEALTSEKEEISNHLHNLEIAFNDVHQKYEKSKNIIEIQMKNEETLKSSLRDYEAAVNAVEKKYQLLKDHANVQFAKANAEMDAIIKQHETEKISYEATIQTMKIKLNSLEDAVNKKTQENNELTKICEELISKMKKSKSDQT